MRFSVFIITILLDTIMYAQDIIQVGCRRISGYIIPEDVQLLPESNRFTPSVDDILKAEKILRKRIQRDECHQLTLKMIGKKYIRQYLGYTNENNKVILIFFTKKGMIKDENRFMEPVSILDGERSHWRVKIDIDNEDIIFYDINGPG